MQKNKGIFKETANGKAPASPSHSSFSEVYLRRRSFSGAKPSKAQKRHTAGITVQRRGNPMPKTEPSLFTQRLKEFFGGYMMNNAMTIKMCAFLLVAVLAAPLLSPTASAKEKIRIIMDTDALAEIDDQHAIAYMLFSGDHFMVDGITTNVGGSRNIEAHFTEAVNVAKMCASPHVPVLKGPAGNYSQIKGNINNATFDGSDAVNFIIERAHAPSDRPLIIYACGNVTNVALALLKDPTIAPKIVIWWMGTFWPIDNACYNHVGDLDAVDALLANPHVAFNIIPWPRVIGTTHEEIYEKMPGKGPQVSPGVPGRWGGSFTCFGDYSVELFQRGVSPNQQRRILLDLVGFAAVKKNVGKFTPYEMGAPSFVRTYPNAEERSRYRLGKWVANNNNPRRVTIWMYPDRDAVYNDFFNTMDNYVLPH